MKNSEKYKTALTRDRAFKKFCSKNSCFGKCPVIQKIRTYRRKNVKCALVWLDLEAEEKKANEKRQKI